MLDSYAYGPAGLLAATTDAMGRITNDTYDHNQDLIAVTTTDPSTSPTTGLQTTYSYDGAGNLVSRSVSAAAAVTSTGPSPAPTTPTITSSRRQPVTSPRGTSVREELDELRAW